MRLFKSIRLIWSALGKFKKAGVFLLLIIFLSAITESAGLWMILPLLEIVINNSDTYTGSISAFKKFLNLFPQNQHLAIVSSIMFLVILVKSIFAIFQNYYSVKFVTDLRRHWEVSVFENYIRGTFRNLIKHKQGVLLNNIINEPIFASKAIRDSVDFLAKSILSFCVFLLILSVNWRVTLIVMSILVAVITLTWKTTKRYSLVTGKKKIKINQQINSLAAESLSGARQIKIFSLESGVVKDFVKKIEVLFNIFIKFTVISKLPKVIGELLMVLIIVSALIFCRYFSDVSLTAIVPFLGFFLISAQRLFANLSMLSSQRMSILSYIPSMQLVESICNDTENVENSTDGELYIKPLENRICFKNISFAYENDKLIFNNLNLEIEKGKITAIAGPSGSGKSTICDLLARFSLPSSGEIFIDDKKLTNYNLKAWRNSIGYISQDTFLFNTTIRENILCGKNDATDDEIKTAVKKAGAEEFIDSLPEGYDTILGDRGVKLSGGQRQRIALARAFVRNSDLLILDEATSSVDTKTERDILRLIYRRNKANTVIIVTHRLSSLKDVDRIVVLDGGKIVESGKYHELIKKSGLFKKIITSANAFD